MLAYSIKNNPSPNNSFHLDFPKNSSPSSISTKNLVNRKNVKVPIHVLDQDLPVSKPPQFNSLKYTKDLVSPTAPISPTIKNHMDEFPPTPSLDKCQSPSPVCSPVLYSALKTNIRGHEKKQYIYSSDYHDRLSMLHLSDNSLDGHRDSKTGKHKGPRIESGIKRKADKNILRSPIKKFNCAECGYTSSRKSNYTRHIEQHDDSRRKWKCNTCDKSYSSKFNLERHKDSTH
ncbi:hypothetical protein CLU79DRAFT_752692 [Phycomyces nitens]|nr:hypothetical protein CLU79DRAFT_752692 [Phycomyces nitens]